MKSVTMDHVNKLVKAEKYAEAFFAVFPIAESGNSLAQHRVAGLFADGLGVARDLEKALDWFGKAAEQDNLDSQYNLAQMFLNGEGTKRSFDKAYYWLRRANRLGDVECGKQMAELDEKVSEEDGALSITVGGFNFEDVAGALLAATDEMSEEQIASMLSSLRANWNEFLSKAAEIADNEGDEEISLSMLADVIPPSLVYSLLADVYEYDQGST